EDVRLRGEFRHEVELPFPRRFHLFRRIEAHVELPGPGPAEAVRPVDLLPREDVRNRVEFRVRGGGQGALPDDHRHRGLLRPRRYRPPGFSPRVFSTEDELPHWCTDYLKW